MDVPDRTAPPLALPTLGLVAGLALLGAVLGPLFDQIHVQNGVLHYPHPDVFGQPWWVFPQFAAAAVLMSLPYRALLPRLPAHERARVSAGQVLGSTALFAGLYFGTALFHRYELLLAAAYAALFAARVARDGGRPVVAHGVVIAIGGTAWEATLCALGAFGYDVERSLFDVPLWLPGLYLHAALFLRQFARWSYAERPDARAAAGGRGDESEAA
jgi:hypothetical protein